MNHLYINVQIDKIKMNKEIRKIKVLHYSTFSDKIDSTRPQPRKFFSSGRYGLTADTAQCVTESAVTVLVPV